MIRRASIILASLLAIALFSTTAFCDDKVEAENLISKATAVVNSFATDPDLEWFREKVKEAKAIMVIPQSIQGAFFIGGSGGSGALLRHEAESGTWGYPAFYTVGSLSFGLQFGGEASEIVLLVMSERGMEKLLARRRHNVGSWTGGGRCCSRNCRCIVICKVQRRVRRGLSFWSSR